MELAGTIDGTESAERNGMASLQRPLRFRIFQPSIPHGVDLPGFRSLPGAPTDPELV